MAFLSRHWRGVAILALGVGTIVATVFFLDTCADAGHFMHMPNGGIAPMRCTWSERSLQGLGGLLAVVGLLMMLRPAVSRVLSMVAAGVGALMLITPTWLVPTCAGPSMTCNLSLKPGALVLGGLVFLMGVAGSIQMTRTAGLQQQA